MSASAVECEVALGAAVCVILPARGTCGHEEPVSDTTHVITAWLDPANELHNTSSIVHPGTHVSIIQ